MEFESKHRAAVENLEQLRVLILQDGWGSILDSCCNVLSYTAIECSCSCPTGSAPGSDTAFLQWLVLACSTLVEAFFFFPPP